MSLNVDDVIASLDPAERRKVEKMASEFIAEEMTLRELRKARELTQVSIARQLGVSQGRRVADGTAQRPIALDPSQNGRGHGRHPIARRKISRSGTG